MLNEGRLSAMAVAAGLLAFVPHLRALDELPGEKEALKACEERVCTMILTKSSVGDDLKCKMSKTWTKGSIKKGQAKGVSWGFGDARCTVNLKLSRADIVAALTKPAHTISSPPLTVKCNVERDATLQPITAKAAPKLVFKDGKADQVWINLKELDGPDDIKGTVWVAANLEDSVGIFHRSLIRSINKFIYRQCPRNYGPEAQAKKQAAKATSETPPPPRADAAPKSEKPQADGVSAADPKATAAGP